MIKVEDKKKCCGCEACVQKCPTQCISMCEDNEGFQYPLVDLSRCIDCKLCERVCPYTNPVLPSSKPLSVWAAKCRDLSVRKKSSSGGLFYLLAEQVLEQQGVVFGVRFDKKWDAVFDAVETINDLPLLMGSKYVQASVGHAYIRVRDLLNQERRVLFTGTPCQVQGLKRFLGKEYDNLYCISVLCHGVPSPKVWHTYLSTFGHRIEYVNFRSKRTGWRNYRVEIHYRSGDADDIQTYSSIFRDNPYMNSFLNDITLRPSCHRCEFKLDNSFSDLILGDFWNIDYVLPFFNDDNGTSIVIACSKKGTALLDDIKIDRVKVIPNRAIDPVSNGGFVSNISFHPNRKRFFRQLGKKPFDKLVFETVNQYSVLSRLKRKLEVVYKNYLKS